MTSKSKVVRRKKILVKEIKKRNEYWPEIGEDELWKTDNGGFVSIPRSMPLILLIIDDLSNGNPLSKTYLELHCRNWNNNSYVCIKNPQELAFASGLRGQRSLTTWKQRMRKLKELGFIKTKEGSSGEFNHILIINPYLVIKEHHRKKNIGIREDAYNALYERALDIGIKDLEDR